MDGYNGTTKINELVIVSREKDEWIERDHGLRQKCTQYQENKSISVDGWVRVQRQGCQCVGAGEEGCQCERGFGGEGCKFIGDRREKLCR